MGIMIDPGSGPVQGKTSYANAYANIQAFIADCEIPLQVTTSFHKPEEGRYFFELSNEEYNYTIQVEMPGLPLDQVRYMGEYGQNIMNFSRVYVDGSSWAWKYAVVGKRHVADYLRTEKERAENKVLRLTELLQKLEGGEE